MYHTNGPLLSSVKLSKQHSKGFAYMSWGIAFKVEATRESSLASFPEPTARIRFNNHNGLSNYVCIYYLFDYAPQSFKELQRIAGIKEQMSRCLPLEFIEDMEITIDPDEIGFKWKVKELGEYFNEYISFPTPLYPQSKDEFMRNLTLYAMKLHYQHRLYFESMLAMGILFNKHIKEQFSRKELQKKAYSIMQLDRSDWKLRLNEKDLKEAHRKGGKARGKQISEDAYIRSEMIQAFLPDYRKENGKYDIAALMELTQLGRRTIYNEITKAKSLQ